MEEAEKKTQTLESNNMHNLNKVNRTRSEMGVFHDYPHYFELKKEGTTSEDALVHGIRNTENGDFFLSNTKDVFCMYGQNYLGTIKTNLLGTCFDVYDFGLDPSSLKDLPRSFLPSRRHIMRIEYDSNFFAEKPRQFRITFYDWKNSYHPTEITHKLVNMTPKFNHSRGCYTLNFFGRVNKASARNFQLIGEDDVDETDVDIILSHGKCSKNEFNLDYRAPFGSLSSFAVSLTAIGKKRVVG